MRRLLPLAGVLVVLAGCGSGDRGGGLAWTHAPLVYAPARLPHDRVVVGQVHNSSRRSLRLDARKLVVHDAAGHPLVSSARFAAGFAHPLYGAFQQPSYNTRFELARLGITIVMYPNRTAPLYVAYRLRPESKSPITVDYGPGDLAVPRRAPARAPDVR